MKASFENINFSRKYRKWLSQNTESLCGKKLAITGSTGGLGRETCIYLAALGASIVLVDRNAKRSAALAKELCERFPFLSVERVECDLSSVSSVKEAAKRLLSMEIDVFIHNAGAYSIPRCISDSGYDNVFTINFIAPYYLIKTLLPSLRERGGRVVVVGSIAHNYSYIDEGDVDFRGVRAASKVYGNAKRYLTYSLFALKGYGDNIAIAHPGIAVTNITSHYPKPVYALIKYPMKLIFMSPKKACLSVLCALFEDCGEREWIGPRFFDVWGKPQIKKLCTASADEAEKIVDIAEKIYEDMTSKEENL